MEYKRIHGVQTGVISPSKLRMKLLGVHSHWRNDGGTPSSRTSPSKLEELEHSKGSLLADQDDDGGLPAGRFLLSQPHPANQRAVLPGRSLPEEGGGGGGSGNGYDSGHESGGAATGFEFHGGERPLVVGPFQRPIPSKWNDAEKWIIGRQPAHPNLIKKTLMQQRYGGGQPLAGNLGKVAPEGVDPLVADSKRVDLSQVATRFPYGSLISHPAPEPRRGAPRMHLYIIFNVLWMLMVVCAAPGVKSVSMRDMGTEMTPMASQEPSRTGTPNGASTPSRSPICSQPSTPRGGARAPVVAPPIEVCSEKVLDARDDGRRAELSEKERRQKTRSEILALGLQLGKMNIAAWASKGDVDNEGGGRAPCEGAHQAQLKRVDFESRAAVWEEAEKTKHTARFKREEAKIQVWESHEKAKIEAEMREVEARAEKMKAQAHERMMRRLSAIKQRSGEKLATAEARRERQVAATCCQAEHIRRTGQPPPPPGCRRLCCLWFS
ncbi:unnamed protein product [Spirodela intermedia]|uniref:Remorin C-terminal domain-containing protein n=1 Tax=Spirodela intermedia TaxID=51605 RepID=A0A7I8L573_SPIIN|nr:unnamed protein product [Spirodela intermedia]